MQGRIVFATGNAGKIKEIRMIMEDTGLEVVSMKDAGIKADIEENGKTYEENALIKARAVTAFTKDIVMADDSGLEIDALNKEPNLFCQISGRGYAVFHKKCKSDPETGRSAGGKAYCQIRLCHCSSTPGRQRTYHKSYHRRADRI